MTEKDVHSFENMLLHTGQVFDVGGTVIMAPPVTEFHILDAVTIYSDGRIEVNEKYTATEAARAFWNAVKEINPFGAPGGDPDNQT